MLLFRSSSGAKGQKAKVFLQHLMYCSVNKFPQTRQILKKKRLQDDFTQMSNLPNSAAEWVMEGLTAFWSVKLCSKFTFKPNQRKSSVLCLQRATTFRSPPADPKLFQEHGARHGCHVSTWPEYFHHLLKLPPLQPRCTRVVVRATGVCVCGMLGFVTGAKFSPGR